MANVTLREGVETSLRQNFPEIGEILDITDHASGESPYITSHYPER
jgi:Fe/S biogenesis protein NfuA